METNTAHRKAALRAQMHPLLHALQAARAASLSHTILERVIALPEFDKARSVLSFVSMAGEVDTHDLIRHCLRAGKRVCVPVFDRSRNAYFAAAIHDFDLDLRLGHYDILEPRDAKPAETQADLAIVPGVAFDRHGHRLGRGKGYFDRLLAGFRGIKVALVFDFQLVDHVPFGDHDIPMDIVVTEARVVRVN